MKKSTIPNKKHLALDLSSSEFSIFSVSDLHLNNRRLGGKRLCHNFQRFLTDYEHLVLAADVFLISGDFYDGLLFYPSEDTRYIHSVIIRILDLCVRGNVKLRVLNGTRTHDWGQCKDFLYLAEAFKGNVDVKYIDALTIERINGYSILYVPDELNAKSLDTYEQAQALMQAESLTQVDYVSLHGPFRYQLDFPGVDTHNETDWMALCRYLIIAGHIHVSVPYGNIVPNGSLDGLVFGEDQNKGGWYFTKQGETIYKERLLNTHQVRFEIFSIPVEELLENALKRLKKVIKALPENSYISIRPHLSHPINPLLREIKQRYPRYHFYKETYGEVKHVVERVEYTAIEITQKNLPDVYRAYLGDHAQRDVLVGMLETLVND
jgi:hypothetical protein